MHHVLASRMHFSLSTEQKKEKSVPNEHTVSVKVYNNDFVLDTQPIANKIVDDAASIKYNKHDSELVNNNDESNPECDSGKPPKKGIKVVIEEHKMTPAKCRDQTKHQDDKLVILRWAGSIFFLFTKDPKFCKVN